MPSYVIKQGGKNYRITVPEGQSQQDAYGYLQQHLGTKTGDVPVEHSSGENFGIGMARGLVGTGEDAATLLGYTGPGRAIGRTLGRTAAAKSLERFSEEPSKSGAETAGRFVGGAAPYMLAPELGVGRAIGTGASKLVQFAPDLATLAALHHTGGLFADILYPAVRSAMQKALQPMLEPMIKAGAQYLPGVGAAVGRGAVAAAGGARGAIKGEGDGSGDSRTGGPRPPAARPSEQTAGSAGGQGD